ncbi:MAG: xylan 1,4-beta-xylosidase [Ruminococcus sp.]|nr:xylan 1,4-beta-xylosidase [Ruminococcus sp.]
MAEKKSKRFVKTYSQELNTVQILQDTVTGVSYLYVAEGGLTPLIDENGKPVITIPQDKK